ncbi:MAG: 6,7-dimethyl-8-ribityllumazine synthase [Actinomycetota bacterium]|nr:6,7-dimethyl-8-ribityllumazine synthase [Acidimicrobiia bacterium]MDQ3470110.1 6,7-dimethyl-8-ribityllumazine synthase [Actinomycetota bacterium]
MAADARSGNVPRPHLDGTSMRIAVVAARFNSHVTGRLLDGARRRLSELGVADHDVTVTWVPGAFEIPAAARLVADSGRVDAVICVGCVIRGETAHFEHVAGQCAAGIMRVGLETTVPVVFSVLTTEDLAQALARSAIPVDDVAPDDGHNAGADGAEVAVEMVALRRQVSGG